jgi:RND family efflux transporter MFP subunit
VKARRSAVAVILLLAAAGLVSYWIQSSEPTAEREAATRRSAALVETIAVEIGTYRPTLTVLGTVRPARDIVLSPRVGGQIIVVEESFTPGGLVRARQPLLRIDPADYEQILVARESEKQQVQAELSIEEGRQQAARREFELLGEDIAEANRSLVLREPQIQSLRAKLRAAEASLQQARLDLERTVIRAPFAAQILDRSVELGSEVSAGDALARIVGVDEYWVLATVPLDKVRWIELPAGDREGARATVRHRTAWREGERRQGRVQRLIGEVDESTRLARVIVAVPRPLGEGGEPSLVLGSIVQVEIEGVPVDDAVRLDRAYLRQDDTVWVLDEGTLSIRSVGVLFSDAEHAFIGEGLEAGDRVVTTNLATVADGLAIRDMSEPVSEREEP